MAFRWQERYYEEGGLKPVIDSPYPDREAARKARKIIFAIVRRRHAKA
jgi:hypothetical protein